MPPTLRSPVFATVAPPPREDRNGRPITTVPLVLEHGRWRLPRYMLDSEGRYDYAQPLQWRGVVLPPSGHGATPMRQLGTANPRRPAPLRHAFAMPRDVDGTPLRRSEIARMERELAERRDRAPRVVVDDAVPVRL